jgi:hypothetical protein
VNPTRWTLLLAAAGIVLVGVSFCLPSVARTGTPWTNEKAVERATAGAQVHRLAHERVHNHGQKQNSAHRHDESSSSGETLAEARARFERTTAELQRAQTAGSGLAAVFWWIGLACIALGGSGYLCIRLADSH